MKYFSLYTVSDRLQKVYRIQSDHNKNYQKIKNIAGFYSSIGERNSHIVDEHYPCWSLLILPMQKSKTEAIRLNPLAYFFYLANMLTFEDKPLIIFTKGKIKNFNESDLDEFMALFYDNYQRVIDDYCEENETNFEDILSEVTKNVYEEKNNDQFTSLMLSMVFQSLTVGQHTIIQEMHEIQDKLIKIISKLNYIDISDMPDMIGKLNNIKNKLENLYEDKAYAMKSYLGAEELQPELMVIKNNNRVTKEVELKTENQLEIEAFMKNLIRK